jgi:cysteine desulfurase
MIYLDNNATTCMSPNTLNSYLQTASLPLNSSSVHQLGQKAQKILRQANQTLSHLIEAKEDEIIYTSGATESLNTYIKNISHQYPSGTIITSANEHMAVLRPLEALKQQGWTIVKLTPDHHGCINLDEIKNNLSSSVRLIALMAANNETGSINDIEAIANLANSHKIPFLVDAVAAFGKMPLRFYPGISAMAFSGHKLHGPQGLGILLLRSSSLFYPLLEGGSQQNGRRSGTVAIASIAAWNTAIREHFQKEADTMSYIKNLRDHFETELTTKISGVLINGGKKRVCNVSNLFFENIDAESLLFQLDQMGVIASHGSACQSGGLEPSYVIKASWGLERAKSSLRFSFSRLNTLSECEKAVQLIIQAVKFQRDLYC